MLINNEFIHVKFYETKKAKATVIFLHGIAENHLRYSELINYLNKNNINVVAYDLRGHGKSGGKRGYVKSIDIFLEDLSEIVELTKRKYDTKIFLIGHSMGALIVNLFLIDNNVVDGAIVSGAAGDFVKQTNFLRIMPAKLLWFIKLKTNFNDPNLSKETSEGVEPEKDPYLLNYFYITLIGETMIKGIRRLRKGYKKITTPYLILHGENDVIIPPDNNLKFYNLMQSEDKKRIVYPGFYHNLLNDKGSESVFEDVKKWIKNQLK